MDKCIFESYTCTGPKQRLQTGGQNRINSIINASRIYKDNLHEKLEHLAKDKNLTIKYHNSCVTSYVSDDHIKAYKNKSGEASEDHEAPAAKRIRRSESQTVFNFRQHCLFCAEECRMDLDPKHPDRWRRVVLCRTADRGDRKTFKQSIIDSCDARQDSMGQEVKLRILGAVSDLHAADARYHIDCRDAFMAPRSVNSARNRNATKNQVTDSAFLSTASEMKADKTRVWNSVELHSLYVSKGGVQLSRRTLVVKLSEHFGSDLLMLSGKGVANLLVFQSKASGLLRLVNKEEDDEVDNAVEIITHCVVRESKQLAADRRHYDSRIDIEKALDSVSPTLLGLLTKLSDKLDRTMPAALIGNVVTSVLTNCATSLQVALGVVLGKRSLIEQFFDFKVSCSYDEVLRFKASAASAAVRNLKMAGIEASNDGIIQVVADNFDATISSQNGILNTHSLAILVTTVETEEQHCRSETFPRLTTEETRDLVIDDVRIERYKGPKKPEMPCSEAKWAVLPFCVLAHQVIALSRARSNDFDFLRQVASDQNTPEFNGYNTKLAREQGHAVKPATRASYRPLIDMTPADPDTMLTAMLDAQGLTNGCGQEVTIFTNDQQLYKVAVDIKWVYQDMFHNFVPRLGGMHLLMSFVGCVGTLMGNTGLEEVMKAAFGGVSNMLSGKKFPQNVRALRIVAEEVLSNTLQTTTTPDNLLVTLESLADQSKTTKLWVNCLIKPVFLMMIFVRAEREADWPLHLYAVKEMLPYFFAARHHNYARYGLYYLRSMERLPEEVLDHFLKGHHVMRHKPGIWNAIWSDMFIESIFMRYGHGANGIIGITLQPSTLKKWAFSMHICSQLIKDVADMTQEYRETEVTTHKEEKPSRIRSDGQDRANIREKLQLCVDPMKTSDHPEGIINIVTGLIALEAVNVEQTVEIGKAQMVSFENSWPTGFYAPLTKQVVTMAVANKSVKVGNKEVYDVNLIYSRVLGLQQSRYIDLNSVFMHELAAMPTSMFKKTGDMCIATGKSSLKKKLQVTVSSRHVQAADTVIMDGCAILWRVHWPCKGTVKEYIDNFHRYVIDRTKSADVYLVFDRYFDYSIKSATRANRSGQHASRRHHLILSSPLPPQKVVLTVTENKVQLIDLICAELVGKGQSEIQMIKHKLVITGKDPKPTEVSKGTSKERADLETLHEEADVIMVQHMVRLAQSGARSITVVSDDTDVFVLLVHFFAELDLKCGLTMEATDSDRAVIDIPATVQAHAEIATKLLAVHCLSGCDTVAQLFGIGKGTALKVLEAGHHLSVLGDLQAPFGDVMAEATLFIGHCYGSKKGTMSEIRVELWSKKMSKKRATSAPDLKSLPPTTEAFRENVHRAHVQTVVWKSTLL